MKQQAASRVPEKATQGAEARRRGQWWWTEASVWTERMVSGAGQRRQRRQVVQSDG